MRQYHYVGPKRVADRAPTEPAGVPIRSSSDLSAWLTATGETGIGGCVIATYVVDALGTLLIADRRSEHVACAGGHPVRAAGEITFAVGLPIGVVGVSNQSTGYCPEVAC